MQLPVAALCAGIMAIFTLVPSARAGSYRGKAGVSILFGDPVNRELAQRVGAGGTALITVVLAISTNWIAVA